MLCIRVFVLIYTWYIRIYVLNGEARLYIQAGCQENMKIAQTLATQLLANLQVCYNYSKHGICG